MVVCVWMRVWTRVWRVPACCPGVTCSLQAARSDGSCEAAGRELQIRREPHPRTLMLNLTSDVNTPRTLMHEQSCTERSDANGAPPAPTAAACRSRQSSIQRRDGSDGSASCSTPALRCCASRVRTGCQLPPGLPATRQAQACAHANTQAAPCKCAPSPPLRRP